MVKPNLRVAGPSRWLHSAVAGPSRAPIPRSKPTRAEDAPTATEKELLSDGEQVVAQAVIRQARVNQRREDKFRLQRPGGKAPAAPGRRFNSTVAGKVKYAVERSVVSAEQQGFFATGFGGEDEGGVEGSDMAVVVEEETGLEAGRMVECRRSGFATIGIILAPVIMGNKPRLLLLRSSGEIWPVSAQDVQYALPRTLIPKELAEQAWSERELDEGFVASPEEREASTAARQKMVMTLRKVERETDRMLGMLVRTKANGVTSIWERFANSDSSKPGAVTATQAAEMLLNKPVRAQTLPAFAAHRMLMARPDLFVGDEGKLWQTGLFSVRSRDQRRLLEDVTRWTREPAGTGPLAGFVERANAIIAVSRARSEAVGPPQPVDVPLPAFTTTDLDLINALQYRQFETRSTQISPFIALTPTIVKATGAYPGETVDQALVQRFLMEIGAITEWDSLSPRRMEAANHRDPAPILLDNLVRVKPTEERHDFTHHTVYVIDDPSAVELDDGISLERIVGGDEFWIHVHVADPTRAIDPEHALAREAARKIASQYYVERNVPLLDDPTVMSQMSLGAIGGAQEVMTFSTRIASDGTIKGTAVRLGMIEKIKVISYQQVDHILGAEVTGFRKPFGGPVAAFAKRTDVEQHHADELALLHALTTSHRMRRMAKSGFNNNLPLASICITDPLPSYSQPPVLHTAFPSLDYSVATQDMSVAQHLVSEAMIMAGITAGRFCSESGIAVPFRTGKPTLIMDNSFSMQDFLAKRHPSLFTIDNFEPMHYSLHTAASSSATYPADHWQMGITASEGGYVRTTSPLRRYGDLLVHWQIRSALAGTQPITHDEMQTEVARLDGVETRVKRAQKANAAYWRVLYLDRIRSGAFKPADATIDLHGPLEARVMGLPMYTSAEHVTAVQVYIESLGLTAKLNRPGLWDQGVWSIGDRLSTRIEEVSVLPNALVTLVEA